MIRCDNDECPLSRECWRFLIAPQDADGVTKHDVIDGKCDRFIEMAQYPDNNN